MKILDLEIPNDKETLVYLKVANLPTRTQIDIPVFIFKSHKPGPTVLFTAGMHGDEINGIEIVRRILDNNINKVERGCSICIPIINVFGFLHFSRYVPDGKDVNRSFPGNKKGSLASRVAWTMMNHILPLIDVGIDFHTGGDQLSNYPQIRGDFSDEALLSLAKKTKAPFLVNSSFIHRSFRKEAYRKGKKILVFEGGESTRFTNLAIQAGVQCAKNLLIAHQMTKPEQEAQSESVLIKNKTWYRSPASGMWVAKVSEGDFIKKGTQMGYITSPYGDFKKKLSAKKDGFVLCLNNQAVVNNGDALINLGSVS